MEHEPPSLSPEEWPESRSPNRLTLESITDVAKENALKYNGHVPTLIVEGSQHSIIMPVHDLADTYEGRAQQMFLSGFLLAQSGQVGTLGQVFFVSEGWMTMVQKGEGFDKLPSQDPNRIEVLTVTNFDVAEQKARLVTFEMVRDDKGRVAALNKFLENEEKERRAESPLLDAFVRGFDTGMRGKIN